MDKFDKIWAVYWGFFMLFVIYSTAFFTTSDTFYLDFALLMLIPIVIITIYYVAQSCGNAPPDEPTSKVCESEADKIVRAEPKGEVRKCLGEPDCVSFRILGQQAGLLDFDIVFHSDDCPAKANPSGEVTYPEVD